MRNIFASSTRGAQLALIIAILGTVLSLGTLDYHALLLILAGYFMYGCLGVVVTYHRYLTHQSYKTHSLIVKLFSLLGCLGGTGSPLAWVAIHINHHRKSDKPTDPHSPLYKGLKIFSLDYAHEVDANTKWKMRSMITDRYQQLLHRYYFAILLVWSVILYTVGGLYLMIWLHWAPLVVTALMSNVVNYIGHKPTWWGGYRTYNLTDQSTNNWLWAIPSWGETWHNNHHRFPRNFSCGQKWWEIDISAAIIKLIKH